MKKIMNLLLCLSLTSVLFSCSSKKYSDITSDSLYVKKIENINDDFILGMDVSSVISLENSGVRYYDFDGNEKDLFQILAENGITHIRVRVWNDPFDKDGMGYGGGNCDIDTAVEIGKRAKKYGLKLIVDFHYSDFWADPSKQMVPKQWEGLQIEEKAEALYQYTKESLEKLKKEKIDVSMVQLGNETNGAMAGETKWMNIVFYLMRNGSKAIREVYPKALVAVHFANPENSESYLTYASKLAYYELDYDVFTSSYYPYWHGTLDNLSSVLSQIAEEYDKKVMVMETSYANTGEDSDFFGNTISDGSAVVKNYPYTVQGQSNAVTDIIDTVVNHTTNGIGVCYWEGAWISVGGSTYEENFSKWQAYGSGWASSYATEYDAKDAGKYYGGSAVDNQAFFDSKGHPFESLKLFGLCRKGNLLEPKPDAIEDTYLEFDLTDSVVLPENVNAVFTDNSRSEINVIWDDFNEAEFKSNGPAKYVIEGLAEGLNAKCYVSIVKFNYLKNPSFEEDKNATLVPSGWNVIEYGKADQLYTEVKATDSLSGNSHYHFWSSSKDSIEFSLEQDIKDLKAGNYDYSISIMGGDAGKSEIYAYVKINDRIIAKAPMSITFYNEWDEGCIDSFEYDGSSDLKVGIYVKCSGQGNGAWGKIDDAKLNSIGG